MKTKKEGRRTKEGRREREVVIIVKEKKKRERQETERVRKLEVENIKKGKSKGDMRKGENRIEKQK